jgi:sporulation protein YlmC with PRC-barrel domain
MRIGDLLDRRVRDVAGRRVGRVRDVRLIGDGPVQQPSGDRAPRLDALIVGHTVGGDRLGFGRGVRGPWLLAVLFAAIRRSQYDVPWVSVASVGRRIVLSVGIEDLDQPRE